MSKVMRVFPSRTKVTPDDSMVRVNRFPAFFDEADEIHISVIFSWDIKMAELLYDQWKHVAPTFIGGPALGMRGDVFKPGKYVKSGYVITSRGCPNRCWHCDVWKREGNIRELPIEEGWNVLDDNLLACSEGHIKAVFEMLKNQPERAQFTGGLEAAILRDWHVDLLSDLKPEQMFFAYDEPDDYEPLRLASKKLTEAGFDRYKMRCYVLIGFKGDTFDRAEKRLRETVDLGFYPMAMLFRGKEGKKDPEWGRFQRNWARPALIYRMLFN